MPLGSGPAHGWLRATLLLSPTNEAQGSAMILFSLMSDQDNRIGGPSLILIKVEDVRFQLARNRVD